MLTAFQSGIVLALVFFVLVPGLVFKQHLIDAE